MSAAVDGPRLQDETLKPQSKPMTITKLSSCFQIVITWKLSKPHQNVRPSLQPAISPKALRLWNQNYVLKNLGIDSRAAFIFLTSTGTSRHSLLAGNRMYLDPVGLINFRVLFPRLRLGTAWKLRQ